MFIIPGNIFEIICKGGGLLVNQLSLGGQLKNIERRMNTSRTLLDELPESSFNPDVIPLEELENLRAEFRRLEFSYQALVKLRLKCDAFNFNITSFRKAREAASNSKSLKFGLREVSERAANHDSLRQFEDQIKKAALRSKLSNPKTPPPAGSEGGKGNESSTFAKGMESKFPGSARYANIESQNAEGMPAEYSPRHSECTLLETHTSEPTDPEYIRAREEFLDKATDVLISSVKLGFPSLHVDSGALRSAIHEVVLGQVTE